MNVHQARRLARLFDEACPPPSPYASDGDPKPTVDIFFEYNDNDLELRFLCQETTLVRWAPSLYIDADGRLVQWDADLPGETDRDRLVRVAITWQYVDRRWEMVAVPIPEIERSAV